MKLAKLAEGGGAADHAGVSQGAVTAAAAAVVASSSATAAATAASSGVGGGLVPGLKPAVEPFFSNSSESHAAEPSVSHVMSTCSTGTGWDQQRWHDANAEIAL